MNAKALAENAVFLSPFAEALHGRRIGVAHYKISEALVGYSVLYRRFQRALARALTSFNAYKERRVAEGWHQSSNEDVNGHLDDFLETVYLASELFAFYECYLVKLFNPSRNIRNNLRTKVKDLKRFSVLLCNHCKHNFAFLQCAEVLYENGSAVSGFCAYQMQSDVAVPVADIHRATPCFSMNWSFRRLITDLLQADLAAAELVKSMPEKGDEQLASLTYTLPFFEQACIIAGMPVAAMPKEPRGPQLTITPQQFFNIELDPHPVALQGSGKMRVFFDLIAPSVGIRLPFVEGEVKVGIANEADPSQPVPAFIRIEFADLEVIDG